MSRIFVHHDKTGKVLGVASVDELAEGKEHPFHLTNEDEGVVELDADDPAHHGHLSEILDRRIEIDPRPKKPRAPKGKGR